jgi:hypothetical protein
MQSDNMQPPLIKEPLFLQIQRLKEEAAAKVLNNNRLKIDAQAAYTQEEKLILWIESLTPEQLKRPYKTSEVIKLASLTGKYCDCPALQEVAQLLRKHGFEHKRNWTNANRNQRYWILKG